MRRLLCLAAVATAMLVSGCAGTGQYPVTRATVGRDDPVRALMLPILPQF